VALRLRLFWAELNDVASRLSSITVGVSQVMLSPVRRVLPLPDRWFAFPQPRSADPASWPKSELLLLGFADCLGPVLPDGVEVAAFGRSVRMRGVSPQFGFLAGIGGHADMPQSTPSDWARELVPLANSITTVLRRHIPTWPDPSNADLRFRAEPTGTSIALGWTNSDNETQVNLAALDLEGAGLL
jgi:hypothetical protein